MQSWDDFLADKKPVVCGIINITPDSFSDGGMYLDRIEIENRISALIDHGAKLIDVGAESTRPGSKEIVFEEELKRLKPFFEIIKENKFESTSFSLDTRHSQTARIAIEHGIEIINDVSAGSFDKEMARTIAEENKLYIAMHSRSNPESMQEFTQYDDLIGEIVGELQEKINTLKYQGLKDSQIMIDPGIGFAKTPQQNLEIIKNIKTLKDQFSYPMMVGVSRKSVIAHIIAQNGQVDDMDLRDEITAEICASLIETGVEVVRVHNVLKVNEFLKT